MIKHSPNIPIFLRQAEDIATYISQIHPHARRIIELGVGFSPWVALTLRKLLPNAEIVVVDKNSEALETLRDYKFTVINDDILNPKLEYYSKSDLLYSIHPPIELIEPMKNIAKLVKTPLLIKPLSEDSYLYGFHNWKVIRLSTCVLYNWSPREEL